MTKEERKEGGKGKGEVVEGGIKAGGGNKFERLIEEERRVGGGDGGNIKCCARPRNSTNSRGTGYQEYEICTSCHPTAGSVESVHQLFSSTWGNFRREVLWWCWIACNGDEINIASKPSIKIKIM